MGGGGRGAPDPPPGSATERLPIEYPPHNFAGTQVLVLRHQVWQPLKDMFLVEFPSLPPFSLPLSLSPIANLA